MLGPEHVYGPYPPDWVAYIIVAIVASPFIMVILAIGAWLGRKSKE